MTSIQMKAECYKVSAVVLAKGHNPTILHPYFLKNEGIVPREWQPSKPPVCTPPFASVSFTSGFSFVVEQERMVVSFNGEKAEDRAEAMAAMARKYVEKLPYVPYSAVGINFDAFCLLSEPSSFIIQRFIKEGPWNSTELPLSAAKQNFTYNCAEYQLNISLEPGKRKSQENQSEQDGIVFHANYHGQCPEDSSLDSVVALLEQAEQRKEHFKNISGLLLGEK